MKPEKIYDHIDQATSSFRAAFDADQFLEYAQVYGDYYGTPKHPTLDLLSDGKDVLLEIDVQGALQVREMYPDALLIFILPPDEPTLLKRLQDRGRRFKRRGDFSRRSRAAKREIRMAKGSRAFDFWVVNDHVEKVSRNENICGIVRHKRVRLSQ